MPGQVSYSSPTCHTRCVSSNPTNSSYLVIIWAAFTLVFFAFLRCSEFTYNGISQFRPRSDLSADCVSFHPSQACPQQMSVLLKGSKTDTYRQGHTLVIACSPSPICAVTAICNYFLATRPRGPLFYFHSGRLLSTIN